MFGSILGVAIGKIIDGSFRLIEKGFDHLDLKGKNQELREQLEIERSRRREAEVDAEAQRLINLERKG